MGEGVKDLLRNRGRGHIANVTDHYKGGGSPKFSPKTALRNVWMIPKWAFTLYFYVNHFFNYSPVS